MLILDNSILGSMLEEVFERARRKNLTLYAYCFDEVPGIMTANYIFHDLEGNDIYSLGSSKGFFTLETEEKDYYSNLGFTFTMKMNTKNPAFPLFYNAGKRLYYICLALFILTAILVLMIAVAAPKLSGYSKK